MGYLGKISAIVTANTGDFSRNLNAAASDVRKFASTVQNNITKAASDAERSFKSIYTPLQTLERSLKAASSMKLSFKGFDGAIRDINVLKERLTSLKGTQVDLILKASGLQTITEFREAIKDISNESFNFAVRFGGIDKIKLIREELQSVSGTSINAVLSAGGLERLKELRETIGSLKGEQLNLALRVGGTETLTKVEQQAAGLTQKDMRLLLKVGGSEALDRVIEELSGVSARSIDALVSVKGTAELDRVIDTFRNLSPEQIDAVIKTVGAQDLEAAVTKMQQLRSAAILAAEPLAVAAQKFSKLSVDAQAGFVAALNVSQTKVQELKQDIDDGVTIGTTRFKALEAQVLRTAEAIDRLAEADALVGQVGTGRTFQFERPLDREALTRASEVRATALKLPGQALADNPEIASLQNRISGLANQYPRLQANLEAAKEAGADYSQQITAIERWRSHLLRLIADQERQIAVSSAQGQSTPLPRFRGERSFIGDRIAAQRAAQENAMFGERAAEVAAEQAAAARQRRARRETFADSLFDTPRRQSSRLFGGGENTLPPTLDQALARTTELDAAYNRLSQTARAALRGQADELDRIARAAREGAAGVGVLAAANDRMAESMERAAAPPPDRNEGNFGAFTSIRSVGARTDISDMGRSSSLEDRRRDVARMSLGIDLESPARQMGLLQGRIASLKGALDTLPVGVRAQFGPAIRAAENNFIRLSAAVNPVPEQIEQAAAHLRDLENTARRLSAIDAFGRNFGNMDEFLSSARVRQFSGEMEAVRGMVAGAADSPARQRAARAAQRLQAVRMAQLQLDEDERGGVILTGRREELARRATRAERVADVRTARATGMTISQVRRRRIQGGDVARGGADNAALALNQLAFAVDDFMSSTGGLEFKLRAISNNITQMAFVLGGTTGLFVGLGAVMAGQLAVGFIKYINNGRTAEDQTKALNDSLARQKTLVEELAQAFESLGESISRGTLSATGERSAEFERQMQDIQRKQAESRRERVGMLDPAVQRERAEQNRIEREMQASGDPAQRAALARDLAASKARERLAIDAAVGRAAATPAPEAVATALRGTVRENEFLEGGRLRRSSRERAEARRAQVDADIAAAGGDPIKLAEVVRARIDERSAVARQSIGISNFDQATEILRAREDVAALQGVLASLEEPVQAAFEQAANEVARASRGPAEQIRQAQEEVARAIELGLPGARLFALQLDQTSGLLDAAYKKLRDATEGKDERGNALSVEERQSRVEAARGEIADLESRRRDIAAQTDAFAYERIVDPQRQIEARMGRARGNLSAAGLEDGRLARRMREIDAERERIRRDAMMPENRTKVMQEILEARDEALNEEAAAIEAATIAIRIFAAALDKASEEVKGNLNSAQQAADEARRADLGNSTPQTQEARRQAEADLEAQREIARRAQTEIAVERDRLEQMQQPERERLAQINEQLMGGGGTPAEREALIREREAITARMEDQARASQGRIDEIRDESTRDEEQRRAAGRGGAMVRSPEERFRLETEQGLADIQAYFDRRAEQNNGIRPDGDAQAQAEAEARFRRDREREARSATAAGRGRELAMTERERFRRDMEEGVVADLTAAARESRDPAALLRQGIANQMESVAPMLQQFAEERQNALLQGPSRAALNVADVSTSQGASELTRLLRGDDSAKDVNLAELQKQTQKFDELIDAIKEANPGVLL